MVTRGRKGFDIGKVSDTAETHRGHAPRSGKEIQFRGTRVSRVFFAQPIVDTGDQVGRETQGRGKKWFEGKREENTMKQEIWR